jgi:hypothetical protein
VTKSQKAALVWFIEHGGDGVRQGRGRCQVLAGGEIAPFYWLTFKTLISGGYLEAYGDWRIRTTVMGHIAA